MKHLACALLVFVLSISFARTQVKSISPRSKAWLKQNDQGEYYEGTYTRQVRNPVINLVSLVSIYEPFDQNKTQQYSVRYFSPDQGEFLLKAEELEVNENYWMQAKDTEVEKGWNQLNGWSTRNLNKYLINPLNLGIIVKSEKEGILKVLPVQAYTDEVEKESDNYTAQFQLGRFISRGKYALYTGFGTENTPLYQGRLKSKSGGKPFPVLIPRRILGATGWYTFKITIYESGSMNAHTYQFSFYHPTYE